MKTFKLNIDGIQYTVKTNKINSNSNYNKGISIFKGKELLSADIIKEDSIARDCAELLIKRSLKPQFELV